MHVKVKNLGILKQAEFDLGDLTIICGTNNMGKTYATYALFGFLWWSDRFLRVDVPDDVVDIVYNEGVAKVDVIPYLEKADEILRNSCRRYSGQLSKIFASKPERFKSAVFQVTIDPLRPSEIIRRTYQRKVQFPEAEFLSMDKAKGEKDLVVTLLTETEKRTVPPELIKDMISRGIVDLLFSKSFPKPFISSAERTGTAIYRKELNFARNRLLKEMIQSDINIDPMELLLKSYQEYPLPVEVNVEFIRKLENVAKEESFLSKKHQNILSDFADIIGGEYIAGSSDTIYYKPDRKQLRLTMDESSSAVRSLLDLGFYLRHVAKPGDLLMVDEPELNLHPENQRRIARLFARLVNLGIRVFMTTHSDYIVKELNTLIMLNHDKPYLKRIAQQEGYQPDEFINAEKIKVFVAEKSAMRLENKSRIGQYHTFVRADIDSVHGIEVDSFDKTINKMNEIQDAILWSGDE